MHDIMQLHKIQKSSFFFYFKYIYENKFLFLGVKIYNHKQQFYKMDRK